MKYLCLFGLVISVLAGCATVTYVEPTAGERSRVRFSSDTYLVTIVRNYSNDQCDGENEWMRLKNGMMLGSSEKNKVFL